VLGYSLLRSVTKLDPTNAAAVAAHYGSVSVVTFPFNLAIGIPLYEAAAQIVIADDDAGVASAQPINSFVEER
jgi:hypothetical protein